MIWRGAIRRPIRLASPVALPVRITTIVFEGRLRPILGRDHTVVIGVQAFEKLILSFGRQFFMQLAGLELLQTDATAFVHIKLPEFPHGRALSAVVIADAPEFVTGELAIGVLIKAAEKGQAFFFRQVLDAWHCAELLLGDESIMILINGFPEIHEWTLRAAHAITFTRRGRLRAFLGLRKGQDRRENARNN